MSDISFCVDTHDETLLCEIKEYIIANIFLLVKNGLFGPDHIKNLDEVYNNYSVLTKNFKDLKFGFFYYGDKEFGYFIVQNRKVIIDERDLYENLKYDIEFLSNSELNNESDNETDCDKKSDDIKEKFKIRLLNGMFKGKVMTIELVTEIESDISFEVIHRYIKKHNMNDISDYFTLSCFIKALRKSHTPKLL